MIGPPDVGGSTVGVKIHNAYLSKFATHRPTHKSLAAINVSPTSPSIMRFTDVLSFCFSILGLYGLVCYLRFLIPRNILPYFSVVLTEAEYLLGRAESIGVIPQPNDYRLALTLYKAVMPLNGWSPHCLSQLFNQFLRIRMESHRAPGILQQIRLAVQCGLTCKLYTLSSRVVAIKVEIKVGYTFFYFILTINEGILASYRRATAHLAFQHAKRHCYCTAYLNGGRGMYASNM